MAEPKVGTSLGRNPFKIQDTFTWEDLRQGSGPTAETARNSWEVAGIPAGTEAHFFYVHMNAFKEQEKFTLVISILLLPHGSLVYSDTSSLRAVKARDLATLAMAHLEGLLGVLLAARVIRRYGGKILEWLESVAAIYEQDGMQ